MTGDRDVYYLLQSWHCQAGTALLRDVPLELALESVRFHGQARLLIPSLDFDSSVGKRVSACVICLAEKGSRVKFQECVIRSRCGDLPCAVTY